MDVVVGQLFTGLSLGSILLLAALGLMWGAAAPPLSSTAAGTKVIGRVAKSHFLCAEGVFGGAPVFTVGFGRVIRGPTATYAEV
ncbi:hypothetical protein [Nocardia brasiliensis]|uniref:hypothetical protein n=1 Tax=Nocardia brasiliensis TaxID=37326 RepID=UPI002454BB28|nr:hypothetical protein [Nocardia brasiliensis]